jgi:hypothetical protein
LDRYETSQERAGPVTPKLVWSLESRSEWSIVLKASLRSSMTTDKHCGFAVISSFVDVVEGEEWSFGGMVRSISRLKLIKVREPMICGCGCEMKSRSSSLELLFGFEMGL